MPSKGHFMSKLCPFETLQMAKIPYKVAKMRSTFCDTLSFHFNISMEILHLSFIRTRSKEPISAIHWQGLTVSGKNGASGPTATPLARVPGNSATELARLPCSEATTASATQLRRLRALVLIWVGTAPCFSGCWSSTVSRIRTSKSFCENTSPGWFCYFWLLMKHIRWDILENIHGNSPPHRPPYPHF